MPLGVLMAFGWLAFVVLSLVGLMAWAWKHGQFKNFEEAKYRMLEDHEPEPWPERKKKEKQSGGIP